MNGATARAARPLGISAFIRCKNENEFIVASIMSIYRFVDEVVVILNNSTDNTQELVETLMASKPKIKLKYYAAECASVGDGYLEKVRGSPSSSIAAYYNWCMAQTTFSHVCKWDGDMIGLPAFGDVRRHIGGADIVMFDGADIIGEDTTSPEARVFRYDLKHARYVDWELYERLEHDYDRIVVLPGPHYLHMKLVKKEWLGRGWVNPNLSATAPLPLTGATASAQPPAVRGRLRRIIKRIRRISWA